MSIPFNGKISLDIRDSTPDWTPYAQPMAPDGAPNVLYIVWDDTGYGAWESYGGLVKMPNMDRILKNGLQYTQFHTTALCSPTRSSLLNGRNATSNGMACIEETTSGFPGSNGRIPFENALISEVLVEKGYNTYAVGKWHVLPEEEANLASSKRHWPLGRGFERFYGYLGGETDQWYPDLVYDNHPIDPPATPEEGYHLSKDLVDKAIGFIKDAKVIAPDKPWLMYFCPGATHAPHHVFKEWADRYKGTFDMGYEAYRELVLANQKKLGLMPENTDLPPINPVGEPGVTTGPEGKPFPIGEYARPWESLSDDQKKLFTRMAEVYAGFATYTDDQIGRLLDYLEASGQMDNTIIVVVSDNGASGEGGPDGSVNENKMFNSVPDDLQENLKHLDDLGSPLTYNHYPTGWAMGFNTPFKMWKRWASYQGGIADLMLVSWPKGITAKGEMRHQYCHAVDIVPTIFECLDVELPETVKGYKQNPLEGTSFRYAFDDGDAKNKKDTQFYMMLGTRSIWHEGWFANTTHVGPPSSWSHFDEDTWELYHLDEDRSQSHNLADENPEMLKKLKKLWDDLSGPMNGLPLDDRAAVELLTQERPQLAKPRDRYIYTPGVAEVPEAVAVNIRGRSYSIMVEVDITKTGAEGVLFSHGGRFGGHSLFIKDNKLNYVYNFLGSTEQQLTSSVPVPTGKSILGVRFEMTGVQDSIPTGTATLYINDKPDATATIRTQPGKFSLGGEGLNIGMDPGQPVTSAYTAPFAFTGGEITEVAVDIGKQQYVDAERELAAAFSRD